MSKERDSITEVPKRVYERETGLSGRIGISKNRQDADGENALGGEEGREREKRGEEKMWRDDGREGEMKRNEMRFSRTTS